MKFGVVVFPGSNCDNDIIYVLKNIMNQTVVKLWHKESDLKGCHFIILPGGFSFGDYLRSGSIANYSPIMKEIVSFANSGGYVLGICNGFQILCESQLLPGALLHNLSHKFICKNTFLKTITTKSIITNINSDRALKIPIAHGEGRYYVSDDVLDVMNNNDQIFAFRIILMLVFIVSLVLSIQTSNSIFDLGSFALSIACQMFVPLIAICYLPWLTKNGIAFGIIVGIITVIFTEHIGQIMFQDLIKWEKWPLTFHYQL